MNFEDRDYLPTQKPWIQNSARLFVCGKAKDAKDAENLLEMLGLLSDTRAINSDSINDTVKTERSN